MDMLDALVQDITTMAQTSSQLMQRYDQRFNVEEVIGAIIFDNLRVDEDILKRDLLNAHSINEKLCYILNTFQKPMLTLSALMTSALRDTDEREMEIVKFLRHLLSNMAYVLKGIAEMKIKLNDADTPGRITVQALLDDLTRAVKNYLPQSSATDLVYAVRNYAITIEVYFWAESFVRFRNVLMADA